MTFKINLFHFIFEYFCSLIIYISTIIFFRKNEAEVQDGFFSYTPDGKESEFVAIERIDQRIGSVTTANPVFFRKLISFYL